MAGCSTLMTSAPKSDRRAVVPGPAITVAMSSTRTPSRGSGDAAVMPRRRSPSRMRWVARRARSRSSGLTNTRLSPPNPGRFRYGPSALSLSAIAGIPIERSRPASRIASCTGNDPSSAGGPSSLLRSAPSVRAAPDDPGSAASSSSVGCGRRAGDELGAVVGAHDEPRPVFLPADGAVPSDGVQAVVVHGPMVNDRRTPWHADTRRGTARGSAPGDAGATRSRVRSAMRSVGARATRPGRRAVRPARDRSPPRCLGTPRTGCRGGT